MISKTGSRKTKYIALAAILIGLFLSMLAFFYVNGVKTQLWEQSIHTMMESTQQGCNTLRVQLDGEYETLGSLSQNLKTISFSQRSVLSSIMENYAFLDEGVSLYLPDGDCLPASAQKDAAVVQDLMNNDRQNGLIDPHISSVTGVNVFNLFVQTTLSDGTIGYLVKEYEIESIVDSFTLSFYNDSGFSYVINTRGDVLIRPPHPNSNKTVQNLFDMLPADQNNPESLAQFAQSLSDSRTGWATFAYQEADTVFCYTPLRLQSDWYLVSIVPQDVVNAQSNQILLDTSLLVASILLGIFLLVAFYLRYIRRMNKQLRSQTAYIEHLYNAIPEGIALMTVDAPYRFLQLNQEGSRLIFAPDDPRRESVQGALLQEILHPDDWDFLSEVFRSTAQDEQKKLFENRIIKSDGSTFWFAGLVEKTLDENGDPVLIATFHDITKEKMAAQEAEREQLQERITLVGAISSAYPVIIRINLTRDTLNFVYIKAGLMVNLGQQTSYSELYQDFMETIHPDFTGEYESRFAPDALRQTLNQETSEIFLETRQMLSDGQFHWTSTQIIYVDNPYSEDKLAILISRRIDTQRHEEEQRRQALQSALQSAQAASVAKTQFLSNMSHDIRTPMNAIVGMTAIASTHLDDKDRVTACLKKINLSSQHLLSLINDILDMSKIESGKLSLREEPFNFAELTADIVELIRPQANACQLQVTCNLTMLKQENVIGDPLRIRQVYLNILSNAVKYTPAGGSIKIEVWQERSTRRGYQCYVFRCSDTGVGMDSAFLEKLFLPFERSQDSTNSKIAGTGLGMAITKNLIDLMTGEIQVTSVPGEGSEFTVTLPLQLQDAQQEEIPPRWQAVRCLMADDDKPTCETAVALLEDMGLRAQFVTSGQDAVYWVTQAQHSDDPFQIVILDWKMPQMDGLETARRIREALGPDIPVIILTAYDWADIECEARAAGVTAFLSKPFYRSKICYLLRELEGDVSAAEPTVPKPQPQYRKKRVLLVEDNELNREIARTLIQEMGIQTEEALDGAEAVDMVARSPESWYDMILMDIQMPKMDGYEATRAIRGLRRKDAQRIPIIAMTANAFEEDVRSALRAGMNAHFSKPIDIDALQKLFQQYFS